MKRVFKVGHVMVTTVIKAAIKVKFIAIGYNSYKFTWSRQSN